MTRLHPILAAVLALQAVPAFSETQPSAPASSAADLATMESKAATDPALRMVMAYVTRSSGTSTARDRLEQRLQYGGGIGHDGLTRPIRIDAPDQLRRAQSRASALSAILAVDLNGDWRVTGEEIRIALGIRSMSGPAEALVTHDANGDGALDMDEMKAAATDKSARYANPRTSPLKLLDFNDDGILTPEEYQRGLAAVSAD